MKDQSTDLQNKLETQIQEDNINIQTEKRYNIIFDVLKREIEHVEKYNREQLNYVG